jgi:hypothetical protein
MVDRAVLVVGSDQEIGLIASFICLSARMTSPVGMLCNRRESCIGHGGMERHSCPDRRRTI